MTVKTKHMAKNSKKAPTSIDDVYSALSAKYKQGIYTGEDITRRDKLSTGSLILDRALDGGFVKGKIIECYGPESSGKSAMAYSLLANSPGINGFIDGESAYEKQTAQMYGVDTENLIVQKPDYIEEGMQMVLDMVDLGVETIIFDSIAGIPTKGELEGNMEDHNVGKKASRMGQLMRKLHHAADAAGTTVYFINQIRDSMQMFGSPFTTPGGHALKFHASYRLWLKSTSKIELGSNKQLIGHVMKINLKKNKFGKPGEDILVPLLYGIGICKEWEIIELGESCGVIEKSGSWYSYNGDKIGQGLWNTYTFLLDNPDLIDTIKKQIDEC